tara:strand:- start:1527 stop:1868 length:342 start_codon:yes stop_codon:yes gene_type:complete
MKTYNTRHVAKVLGMTSRNVNYLANKGIISHVSQIGKHKEFTQDNINEFIKKSRRYVNFEEMYLTTKIGTKNTYFVISKNFEFQFEVENGIVRERVYAREIIDFIMSKGFAVI